jgi:hypothetical protein
MKALGIRYVLVRGDIDRSLAGELGRSVSDEKVYEEGLSQSSLVAPVAQFGPLTVYESTSTDVGLMATWSGVRDPGAATFLGSRPGSDEVATVGSQPGMNLPDGALQSSPELRLTEISETSYVAEIDDVEGPFLLTLNQNFDEGWTATLAGRDDSLPHIVANDFANGWVVQGEGPMRVIVEYRPERWSLLARAVSIAGLIVLGMVLLRTLVWKKPMAADDTIISSGE